MTIWQSLRLFLRQMRHAPGYAAMVVVTLGLAIGANSAVFSAVHAVLMRPLPVTDPDRAVVVWQTDNMQGQAVVELTLRHLREWTADQSVFLRAAVMGSHTWDVVLEDERNEPTRVFFSGVSAGFFETLGVRPLLGRTLSADDDRPSSPPVLVLSHASWVRRFGSDPQIVGKTMNLDGQPVQIVGVMPEGFDVPRGAEFWAPVMPVLSGGGSAPPAAIENVINNVGVFYIVGRVRPGATARDIESQLDALDARLQREVPGRPKWGDRAVAVPLIDFLFGPVRPALWALWAAVTVLLAIACANVSGLMLTRAIARRRDDAVRLALGATRATLGRAWIVEILALSVAGGALGLVAAAYLARLIAALAPDDIAGVQQIAVDGTVTLFTFAAVALAALIAGVLPLRQLSAVNLVETFASGIRATAGRHSVRARSALVVGQIALSVALLVAAGLVVRSFVNLHRIDLGFQPANVLTFSVQPRSIQGPLNPWIHELVGRLETLPGVEAAGAVSLRPLQLGPIGQGVRVWLEGQPETDAAAATNPILNYQVVTPTYFETMRIPLIHGRAFTAADRGGNNRVALVSEATAERLWPGRDPIGRRILMSSFTPGSPGRVWRTVVGVVRNVRYRGVNEVQLDVYDPALQVGLAAASVAVRTSGSPIGLIPALQAQVRSLDATAVVDNIVTMDAVVARAIAPWRLAMWMFLLFAAIAFGLAVVGLVSVVALDVAHRRHEFAVRIALGAWRGDVLRAALARTLWRLAFGLIAGVCVAVMAARAMRALLFEVAPLDVLTFAVVIALVAIATAIAAYIPGRRAADTDVNSLLRNF